MTLKEKKYQLVSSLLSIDSLEELELMERVLESLPNQGNRMSLTEYNRIIDEGLSDPQEGRVFTTSDLKSSLRLNQ
ncbi:MAG: hypothetical protein GW809_09730 [Bacteroidetes bacterium]|nr:hypothetical protein [Bacteroidota bacterium]